MPTKLQTWISPMLARRARGIPVDLAEWTIEPKWDGWRCLARIDQGHLSCSPVVEPHLPAGIRLLGDGVGAIVVSDR